MNQKTTILLVMAVLSVTLIRGFVIQAAEAAVSAPEPRLPLRIGPITVSEREVRSI